jgi:hypothetical protein
MGDEFEILGARIMIRAGQARAGGLAEAAAKGPAKHYTLTDAATKPEELHLLIQRTLPCDEKAWAKHCPKPVDWKDEP